jgi:hypothetical protein
MPSFARPNRFGRLIATLESSRPAPGQTHAVIPLGTKEALQLAVLGAELGERFRPEVPQWRLSTAWLRFLREGTFAEMFMEAFGDVDFSVLQSAAKEQGYALRVRPGPVEERTDDAPRSEVDGAFVQ